jgi:dsRNA-specific ribonuclease
MSGVSKRTYSRFARNLGFEEFILYTIDEHSRTSIKIASILEDVFESFIGCLEYLIDLLFLENSGYGVVYIFMTKIMDKEKISLDLENLYDPKSMLNQDIHPLRNYIDMKYVVQDRFDKYKQDSEITKDNRFEVKIILSDVNTGSILLVSTSAYGTSVKNAEHIAAKNLRMLPEFQRIREKYEKIKQQNKKI